MAQTGWEQMYAPLGHPALLTFFTIRPSGRPDHYITLLFLAMTWVVALIGYGFSRYESKARGQERAFENWTFIYYLVVPPWARPLFSFAAFDLVFWQVVALQGVDTAVILGAGYAALLGLFASL